jgi:V/A-type H+/Na+-transporting ATPase subunit D
MALLHVAPTKSSLLALRRQLAIAEEGYDLLEQKRQILIFELMGRIGRAQAVEQHAAEMLRQAFAALRQATLDIGAMGLDRALLAVPMNHQLELSSQRLMGLRLPHVAARIAAPAAHFGVGSTSANCDVAQRRFVEALPLLAELTELQNAVVRLALELRKTQRRCNALTKTFIPSYRQTIAYIVGVLEERDRETFATMKMIRKRLAEGAPGRA